MESALRAAHRAALPARQAEAGVHLGHLAHLDARRDRRRHGADHRAGADDRPAAGAARSHPRLATRTSTSGRPSGIADYHAEADKLRQVPHVVGAAPAILGQGADHGGDAARRSSAQGHRPGARAERHRPRAARCSSGSLDGARRRRPTTSVGRHPARQGSGGASSASTVGDSVSVLTPAGHAVADGHDAADAAAARRRHLQPRALRVRFAVRASCRSTSPSGCSARTRSTSSSCASTTSTRRRRSPQSIPTTLGDRVRRAGLGRHEPVAVLGAVAREDGHLARPSASS